MARRAVRTRNSPLRKQRGHRSGNSGGRVPVASTLESLILALLAEHNDGLGAGEIAEMLAQGPRQLAGLRKTLAGLVDQGRIEQRGRLFAPAAPPKRLRAVIDITSKGFGFAMIEGEAKGGKDVFIPPQHLGGASHGDTVLVVVTGASRGRREGRVVQVVQRGVTRLCGLFTASGSGGYVTPEDERLPFTLLIRRGDEAGAQDGLAVVAEITDYGSERQGPTGRVVEVLGEATSATVQIRMAMIQFGLREGFPAEVLAEARQLAPVTACEPGREDLRHLAHVTIDGETARDFDDAICVERTADGFTLHVSIADVSHYVALGTAIDREAYRRGTSVYLPDRVLPMLPERLSNDLCSLVPDQDRPAFTAILRYDHQGRPVGQRYCKSLIRSRCRFTYTMVNRILYRREPEARAAHADLVPMLEQAGELVALLKQRRIERGSLEFRIPEAEVRLEGERVAAIAMAERNRAHMLIEDCMLAANEAVAESLSKANRPVLYRIHEYPDIGKVETFTDAAKAMGLQLPRSPINPAWFAQVLTQANGTPAEYVVNNLLLRTMQQARYAPENVGHFGLAAGYYLHFTSPIRRYPDLIAHRVLAALLAGEPVEAGQQPFPAREGGLAEAGLQLSQCERQAIDVERNVQARMGALLLLDRVGETFAAIISGVTGFGLFVSLKEIFVSGAVPLKEMRDDYYLFDGRRFRLIGETSNRLYQLGQEVVVRLEQVDLATKRLTFSLVTEPAGDALADKG